MRRCDVFLERSVLLRQDLQFADEERAVAAVPESVVAVSHADMMCASGEVDFREIVARSDVRCDFTGGDGCAVDFDPDLGVDALIGVADGIDVNDV